MDRFHVPSTGVRVADLALFQGHTDVISLEPFDKIRSPCKVDGAGPHYFFELDDLLRIIRDGGTNPVATGRPLTLNDIHPILTPDMPATQYELTLHKLACAGWHNEEEVLYDLKQQPPSSQRIVYSTDFLRLMHMMRANYPPLAR